MHQMEDMHVKSQLNEDIFGFSQTVLNYLSLDLPSGFY